MSTVKEPEIKVSNPENRWVALDIIDSNVVISEGKSPEEVAQLAKKTGKEFILMFVPKKGETYIF